MYRRRPIRRPLRPLRPGVRRGVPKALVLANQAFESGAYADAAARFAAIATAAESLGGERAPQFFFQAGRAAVLDGQIEAGLAHLKHGLQLLAARGIGLRLHAAGRRIIAELKERGLQDEAGQITAFLQDNLPGDFDPSHVEAVTRKAVLPTHCPSCGAGLRPDEVAWLDDSTVECTYCGSPVRGDA